MDPFYGGNDAKNSAFRRERLVRVLFFLAHENRAVTAHMEFYLCEIRSSNSSTNLIVHNILPLVFTCNTKFWWHRRHHLGDKLVDSELVGCLQFSPLTVPLRIKLECIAICGVCLSCVLLVEAELAWFLASDIAAVYSMVPSLMVA